MNGQNKKPRFCVIVVAAKSHDSVEERFYRFHRAYEQAEQDFSHLSTWFSKVNRTEHGVIVGLRDCELKKTLLRNVVPAFTGTSKPEESELPILHLGGKPCPELHSKIAVVVREHGRSMKPNRVLKQVGGTIGDKWLVSRARAIWRYDQHYGTDLLNDCIAGKAALDTIYNAYLKDRFKYGKEVA